MSARQVTIDQAIELLNELVQLDRQCVTNLIRARFPTTQRWSGTLPCNSALAQHPTVQCDSSGAVGLLGIINGLFGTLDEGDRAGWGFITAVLDDRAQVVRFERTKP